MIDENKLRYEYKMIAGANQLSDVFRKIKSHPSVFRKHFPDRVVNNVYFDSPGLKSFYSHVSGAANREKLRIRWYGNVEDKVEKPVLERKIKYGQVGEKYYFPLAEMNLNGAGPWPIPCENISKLCNFENAPHWMLRTVEPVLALRYLRHYFVSGDNQFRVTVDENIEYFGLNSRGIPVSTPNQPSPVIIEIKYDKAHAGDADKITNQLPFRITNFSKYIYALQGVR